MLFIQNCSRHQTILINQRLTTNITDKKNINSNFSHIHNNSQVISFLCFVSEVDASFDHGLVFDDYSNWILVGIREATTIQLLEWNSLINCYPVHQKFRKYGICKIISKCHRRILKGFEFKYPRRRLSNYQSNALEKSLMHVCYKITWSVFIPSYSMFKCIGFPWFPQEKINFWHQRDPSPDWMGSSEVLALSRTVF